MMSTVSWPKEWYIKKWPVKQKIDTSKVWNIAWFWWIQWIAWNTTWAKVSDIIKTKEISRLWTISKNENNATLWAVYDLTSWKTPEDVMWAYPELKDKREPIMWYLADAQNLEVDDKKLYETYPELSKDIKTQIRSQFKSQIEQLDADQELIDNPLSSKEKAWAVALWTAQWLWDVWYKIVWEKINKLWAKIWEKIKDKKRAKDFTMWVAKDVMWASDEDIKEYQASEELRKAWANADSSEENANILRAVWWRKIEQSKSWQLGKKVGKFIWQTSLELAAWWVAWWAAKKIVWSTAKTFIWKKIKWAVIWAAAWLWWTEATTLSKEWRLATSKELKKGALYGWIWWAMFASQIAPTERNVWDYLLKWLTKKEYADRAASLWLKTNLAGKVKNVFSEVEQKMINYTKWIINPKKTSIQNMNKINNTIKQESEKLEWVVSKFKYKANIKNIKWEFNKIQPPQSLKSDDTLNKTYEFVKDKYLKAIESTDKSALSLLKVRKEFDKLIEKEIPWLWSSPASNPMKMAIQDLRRVPNNIINNMIWDDVVKKSLEKQSYLFDAIALLKTRAEKVWTTTISRRARKNKELLKAWWLVVWGAVGSRAVSAWGQWWYIE